MTYKNKKYQGEIEIEQKKVDFENAENATFNSLTNFNIDNYVFKIKKSINIVETY